VQRAEFLVRKILRPLVPGGLRHVLNRALHRAREWQGRARAARGMRAVERARRASRPLVKQYRRSFARPMPPLYDMDYYRREYFPPDAGPLPWLDQPDALERVAARRGLTALQREHCAAFARDGFVVVEGLVSEAQIDRTWQAYERAIAQGVVTPPAEKVTGQDPWPGRVLNPHHRIGEFRSILHHRGILRWIALFLGQRVMPYQTIAAHKGSQQLAHSDAIHMSTYPLGYMAAAWIACEDIHPDCGPLFYYPGSHRLDYVLSREIGMAPQDNANDQYRHYVDRYEPLIGARIRDLGLQPRVFTARKGDVLFWHHNLLHGAIPRRDLALSRKSIVCHYFARGAIAYHDLTASLADLSAADRAA